MTYGVYFVNGNDSLSLSITTIRKFGCLVIVVIEIDVPHQVCPVLMV
jgi:hypothetical protein